MRFSLTLAALSAALSTPSAATPVGKPVDARFKAPANGWSSDSARGSDTAPGTMRNSSSRSQVLISNPGHIYLAEYVDAGSGSNGSASFAQRFGYPVSGNPSWMAFTEPNYIYAVDEWSDETRLFQLSEGGVGNGNDGLKQVAGQKGSSGVVHLAFTEDGSRMIGAGYGSGKIDIWNTENHGLELIKTITVDVNVDVNATQPGHHARPQDHHHHQRQVQADPVSHPHQSVLDPSGRFFVVNDLGLNQLILIDTKDDAFNIAATIPVDPHGSGPRHGAFYPPTAAAGPGNGSAQATHYIVACELSSKLIVWELQYATDTISFKQVESVSTLNPQNPGATPDKAAAGELAIVGPHDLYVSNRLTGDATDNIAHFKIAVGASGNHTAPGSGGAPGNGTATGPPRPHFRDSSSVSKNGTASSLSLSFAGQVSSGGTLPRMFSFSEDKKSLFVGNQQGADGIAVFARGANGTLASTPKATIPGSVFGMQNQPNGPQFVQQI